MWAVIRAAWHDLNAGGRAAVLIVLVLAAAGLLGVAMWLGYNLDWLPNLLGQAVDGG